MGEGIRVKKETEREKRLRKETACYKIHRDKVRKQR